jgi:hypothetical protein
LVAVLLLVLEYGTFLCPKPGSGIHPGVWQAAIMKKGNYYPFDIKSCYGIIGDMGGSMYEKRKLLSIE